MQTFLFACLCFVALRGASGAGFLSSSLTSPVSSSLRSPVSGGSFLGSSLSYRSFPLATSFVKSAKSNLKFAPAICSSNLRGYILPTVCAQGFGRPPPQKDKKKKKKSSTDDKPKGLSTEEEQASIRASLGYSDRWEDLARKWKDSADTAKTAETGFFSSFGIQQSRAQAETTSQFAQRKAEEAQAKGLQGVAAAWTRFAGAWEKAAQATAGATSDGWTAARAKMVAQAARETAKLATAAGEKFEGTVTAWTETAEAFSNAAKDLEPTIIMSTFGPQELDAQTFPGLSSILAVALITLFVGSGVTYMVNRLRCDALTAKELLLAS